MNAKRQRAALPFDAGAISPGISQVLLLAGTSLRVLDGQLGGGSLQGVDVEL